MLKKQMRRFCTRVSYDTINSQVKVASYAVRGPIVSRSMELFKVLSDDRLNNKKTLPFDEIISCNIGNPHHLEQAPLSYIRDVLSLTMNPDLAKRTKFPDDVIKRGIFIDTQCIASVIFFSPLYQLTSI